MIKHHKFYTRIDARGLALKLARKDARLKKEDALSDARGLALKLALKLARKRVKEKKMGQTSGARKLALKLALKLFRLKYV
jgi:hypothetical protein